MIFQKQEIEILNSILKISHELEMCSTDGHFDENKMSILNHLLLSLSTSQSSELQKISTAQDHLYPQMSLRHFLNFMIPVERALGKTRKDEDFIITKNDLNYNSTEHAKEQTNNFTNEQANEKIPLTLILDNIRSAFNVGSIFRLSDGLGIQHIHLCGYTPKPSDKSSLGTANTTNSSQHPHLINAINECKRNQITVYALETAKKSQSLFSIEFQKPAAILVGNERFGLSAEDLSLCDQVIHLPMAGQKNSMNVANMLAIAAFEWKRQWLK